MADWRDDRSRGWGGEWQSGWRDESGDGWRDDRSRGWGGEWQSGGGRGSGDHWQSDEGWCDEGWGDERLPEAEVSPAVAEVSPAVAEVFDIPYSRNLPVSANCREHNEALKLFREYCESRGVASF